MNLFAFRHRGVPPPLLSMSEARCRSFRKTTTVPLTIFTLSFTCCYTDANTYTRFSALPALLHLMYLSLSFRYTLSDGHLCFLSCCFSCHLLNCQFYTALFVIVPTSSQKLANTNVLPDRPCLSTHIDQSRRRRQQAFHLTDPLLSLTKTNLSTR